MRDEYDEELDEGDDVIKTVMGSQQTDPKPRLISCRLGEGGTVIMLPALPGSAGTGAGNWAINRRWQSHKAYSGTF